MSKRLEHVEEAKREAIRLGATIEMGYTSRHIVGVLAINGKQRKVFLSKTASDYRVCANVREDVRKKVKEMVK